ncbi:hypothetical protein Plhal304r1_c039g0117291 [Plasmopara halstedii]
MLRGQIDKAMADESSFSDSQKVDTSSSGVLLYLTNIEFRECFGSVYVLPRYDQCANVSVSCKSQSR